MVVVLCGVIVSSVLCLVCAQSDNCGSSVATLVTRGRPLIEGEYPWLVALYQQEEAGRWSQFCGGALVSPRVVLTAAHCLVFDGEVIKPEKVKVGLGKLFRDFYHNEDYATIANVREIVVPQRYVGSLSSFALDVGLLKLSIIVEISDYVLPVCIDLDIITNIRTGATVHAAGWGTSENGTSTEKALAADLSYLDYQACLIQVRFSYRKYITHDKICSLSINGSQVDRGDSGGALTFFKNGRHFVVGVVSTKIIDQTSFSIFTDLSTPEIHVWLKGQIASLTLPDYNEGYLFIHGLRKLYKAPVGTSKVSAVTPVDVGYVATQVAVDCVTGLIYWLNREDIIKQGTLNASNVKEFVPTGSFSFFGQTLDWIGRKLYWLDDNKNKRILKAASLNTGKIEIIVRDITTNTRLPIVHPTLRKIYLITDHKRVDSVDLDSSTPTITLFHAEGNGGVDDIAIDWQTNDLCWTGGNRGTTTIKCKNLVTEAQRTVMSDFPRSHYRSPEGLIITPYNYYWNDVKAIRRLSKTSSKVESFTLTSMPLNVFEGFNLLYETCPNLTPAPSS